MVASEEIFEKDILTKGDASLEVVEWHLRTLVNVADSIVEDEAIFWHCCLVFFTDGIMIS